jgi:hypothetical protein
MLTGRIRNRVAFVKGLAGLDGSLVRKEKK